MLLGFGYRFDSLSRTKPDEFREAFSKVMSPRSTPRYRMLLLLRMYLPSLPFLVSFSR